MSHFIGTHCSPVTLGTKSHKSDAEDEEGDEGDDAHLWKKPTQYTDHPNWSHS